mmetsp:Transcript_26732/g.70249  ORF Transcript_26732/g.70249 Transcript_26732/m.70249 type:complete len:242 (+) Transcript_26732:565-1290(+)
MKGQRAKATSLPWSGSSASAASSSALAAAIPTGCAAPTCGQCTARSDADNPKTLSNASRTPFTACGSIVVSTISSAPSARASSGASVDTADFAADSATSRDRLTAPMPHPRKESNVLSNPVPPTVAGASASAAERGGPLSISFARIRSLAAASVRGVTVPGPAPLLVAGPAASIPSSWATAAAPPPPPPPLWSIMYSTASAMPNVPSTAWVGVTSRPAVRLSHRPHCVAGRMATGCPAITP